jgi:hypothetical protein
MRIIRTPAASPASLAAAALAVIAAAALAGCGQVRASYAAHRSTGLSGAVQAGARLCADPAAVTGVRIVRTPSLSQLGQTKPLRRPIPGITVRDPAAARRLAMAICGLPALPHPVWQCPIVVGGGYLLEFMSGNRPFHPVTVQASGCEVVTGGGAGGARRVARTSRFWTRLAELTGISAPAHSP